MTLKSHCIEKFLAQADNALTDAGRHLVKTAGLHADHGFHLIGGVNQLKQATRFRTRRDEVEIESAPGCSNYRKGTRSVEAAYLAEVESDLRATRNGLTQGFARAPEMSCRPVAAQNRRWTIRRVDQTEFGRLLHVRSCPGR